MSTGGWNLPPGVTVDMLPGNLPSDEAWEEMLDDLECSMIQIISDWEEKTNDRWDREEVLDALMERLRRIGGDG
jgi:hypothetical protein